MTDRSKDDSEDFAALLAEYEAHTPAARKEPRVGDKVRGTVVQIGDDHVFVDLGAKMEGTLERAELESDDGELTVRIGDELEASVVAKDDRTGSLVLRSRFGGRRTEADELAQAAEHGLPVEGMVTAVNKGGVEVQVAGVRAFCPISQLDLRFVEDPEAFVGQRLAFRVTRFEGGRRPNVVLSRRALLEQDQAERAAETRQALEVGAVLHGTVTSLKDYGAFVDIGGLEGMIHISELALGRVGHPSEVLAVGQQVEVAVLRIEQTGDPRRPEKIALSVRALHADPWQDAAERFAVGTRVAGTVAKLQPFGAFVELAPGVEGLVHISELGAGRRVNHPREVVNVGDQVEATVLSVEPDKRRIGLSMGAARQADAEHEERAAVADYNRPNQSLGTFGDLLKNSLKDKS